MVTLSLEPTVIRAYPSTSSRTFQWPSSSVQPGDLLVVHFANGNAVDGNSSDTPTRSGGGAWTKAFPSYVNGRMLFTKVAEASDLDVTWSMTTGATSYGIMIWAVRKGAVHSLTGGYPGSTTSHAAIAKPCLALKITAATQSGGDFPYENNENAQQSTKWKFFGANETIQTFGTYTGIWHSSNSNYIHAVFEGVNEPPTATVTAPVADEKIDPRADLPVAWTYSDADGNPQVQWEVGWKLASDSIYATVGSGANANASFTIPADTLPDEADVDISVRVYDGSAWSSTAVQRIRSDSWTYGPEVTTATQAVDVGPVGVSGDHEAQVRTADATGFGLWSTETVTFLAADTLAADITAVPAGLTAGVTAPTTGVGKSVYHNAHAAPVVATNFLRNPSLEVDSVGFQGIGSAGATFTRDTEIKKVGNYSGKFVLTTSSNKGAAWHLSAYAQTGQLVSWREWVYIPDGRKAYAYWEGTVVSTGGYAGGSAGATVTTPAGGGWVEVVGSVTVAADREVRTVGFLVTTATSSTLPVGFTFYADAAVADIGSVVTSYFDGDSIDPAERYFYRWTGVPHQSTSEKLDTQVARQATLAAPAPVVTAANTITVNAEAEEVENLVPNSSFETDLYGVGSANGAVLTRQAISKITGEYGVRVSAPANGIADSGINLTAYSSYKAEWNLVQGEEYTLSVDIRAITAGEYVLSVQGPATGAHVRPSVTLSANEIGNLSITWTAQASGHVSVYVLRRTANQVCDWDIDNVILVKSNQAPEPFDGSTVEADKNLALGRGIGAESRLTDGITNQSSAEHYTGKSAISGPQSVIIDLGEVKTIDEVKVWHYYADSRTYHNTKTQVSRDGVNWITVFDSRSQGEYQETYLGMTHRFAPTEVRYIKDWAGENSINTSAHWMEIQAYHRSANALTYSWNGTPNASTSTRRKTLANNLYVPHPHVGAAYNLFAKPPASAIELKNGGPITIYWNGLFAVPADMILDAASPTTTVYLKPTTPAYTEEQYRAKFTEGFTRITRRVELLEADGQTLWDDTAGNESRLISGGVSVDYTRNERRSADIELANFDRALVHKPGGFWYDKTLRLYRGVQFYDVSGMREYEVPVGTFMIDRVSEARFPRTVKVTARDFTKKCLLSKFTQATAFEANELIEDVIGTLAANSGVSKRILPTTGKTLGITYTFERGKSRWDAMKEIATAFGYELFFDAQGFLVMRKFLDPTLSPVSHEFVTGPSTGNLVNWDRSANDTRIFNHISVIGADTDTVPVWADARNENPLSPTNIATLGDRVDTYESALVTTFEQAEELAETFLKIAALEEYEINMQSIVYPWLEAGEIVRFRDPERASDDEPDRFLLTNFDIPMGLSPMSAVGRRVTIVS